MISEWLKVMLEEIAGKKAEAERGRAEEKARAEENLGAEEKTKAVARSHTRPRTGIDRAQ